MNHEQVNKVIDSMQLASEDLSFAASICRTAQQESWMNRIEDARQHVCRVRVAFFNKMWERQEVAP